MEGKLEEYRFKDLLAFKEALKKAPAPAWTEQRNIGSRSVPYIGIAVKEALADTMFKEWNVVEEKYMNVLNEIVCTVKINALPDYVGADYITFTGSASKPIQVDAKSIASEFPKGKKANALEYCLPAVRSESIGNAFETLGNIFGRNLARNASNDFGFDLAYVTATKGE